MVGNVETCTAASCSFSITFLVSTSTTLTKSHVETITNRLDASIVIKVRIEIPVAFDATVTAGYHLSLVVTDATATDVTNGTTSSVLNTFGLQLGTTRFATFTPMILYIDQLISLVSFSIANVYLAVNIVQTLRAFDNLLSIQKNLKLVKYPTSGDSSNIRELWTRAPENIFL